MLLALFPKAMKPVFWVSSIMSAGIGGIERSRPWEVVPPVADVSPDWLVSPVVILPCVMFPQNETGLFVKLLAEKFPPIDVPPDENPNMLRLKVFLIKNYKN